MLSYRCYTVLSRKQLHKKKKKNTFSSQMLLLGELIMYMYICVLCMCRCPRRTDEGRESPETKIIGNSEPPNVDVRK